MKIMVANFSKKTCQLAVPFEKGFPEEPELWVDPATAADPETLVAAYKTAQRRYEELKREWQKTGTRW